SSAFSPWSPSRRAVQPATASRAASGAYSACRTPTSPVAARPSRAAWRRPPAAPPPSPARRPPPMTRAWRPSPGAARPASSPPAGLLARLGLALDDGGCLRASLCGNGQLDDGEECDDGPENSDTLPDHCRTDCSDPWCGDGVVDPGDGEECEPPGTLLCDADC